MILIDEVDNYMKIQKIESNKWLGVVSALAGIFVLATATSTWEYAGGAFLLITGMVLYWINR